jgi:carbamoyl-phosphate synthase/aspartate carbamoyltransferase/dihydroorotase
MAGASEEHIDELPVLAQNVPALKVYLNDTYGSLRVEGIEPLRRIFQSWPPRKPIALHAEGKSLTQAIAMSAIYDKHIHICHVARKAEIELIADAKARGLKVTCEVTPHHLFLTEADADRLGPLGDMCPRLGTQEDVDALWQHINTTIDCIASDHAPHTLEEKGLAGKLEAIPIEAPPGVPGLESTLPLLLTAASEGRLSYDRIQELLYTNPRRIFALHEQPKTWVEVDEKSAYVFPDHPLYTKCGWSPFESRRMTGRITRVVFKGNTVYQDGKVLSV